MFVQPKQTPRRGADRIPPRLDARRPASRRATAERLESRALLATTFYPLGDLPGGIFPGGELPNTVPNAVSGDGFTVVGQSLFALGYEAFRWTADTGIRPLATLPADYFQGAEATAVNFDGSVVVGNIRYDNETPSGAFRWTEGEGIQVVVPGLSKAVGVSADGSAVAGELVTGFRWTAAGSQVIAALPSPGTPSITVTAISRDGSTVVGRSTANPYPTAFRWTEAGGTEKLGDLSPSTATAVNADGSVIYGTAGNTFRWTAATGMRMLQNPDGSAVNFTPLATTADGSVIVGEKVTRISRIENRSEAFIWDEVHGTRTIANFLADQGIDLPGWTIERASGISDDGRTIVGSGHTGMRGVFGPVLGWIARLDVAPASVPRVVGRQVFYNHSAFVGDDSFPDPYQGAIATDKVALLAGEGAAPSFANVTSYDKGMNGVIVDVAHLPPGLTPAAGDFQFRRVAFPGAQAGEGTDPPDRILLRHGAGTRGSDRITLIWRDYDPSQPSVASQAPANTWLEVTARPASNLGLSRPDVFYFGNLIGDTRDSATTFRVNALDLAAVKRTLNSAAPVTSTTDINRDGRIDALDLATVKRSLGHILPVPAQPAATAAPPRRVAEEVLLSGRAAVNKRTIRA